VIKLLIADDHPLVRDALANLLTGAPDIEVVGVAADGREAVEVALATSPDVVLMDLEMPELNGIELNGMDATRALREAGSDARVVVLTTFSDRDRILGALDAGALGYLLKDADPEEILRGVRAAARGESPLAPRAAHELLIERAGGQARPEADLSAREQEVLALVAEGLPNKLIARRLQISEKTVKAHLTSVFAAIGVTDRTQAALWAHRHKLGR
jgi:DNA-binding NarL/FixJ family response regulator